MNIKKLPFIIIVSAFFFILSSLVVFGEKQGVENLDPTRAISPGEYHMKVKVSTKDESALKTFSSTDLKWSNEEAVFGPPNPGWSTDNGDYIWTPTDLETVRGRVFKVPLQQQEVTKNIPLKTLDEIQIEYQVEG